MNRIFKSPGVFLEEKSTDYWFPKDNKDKLFFRKLKIQNIFKLNVNIDTSLSSLIHTHYHYINHPIRKTYTIKIR